MKRDAQGKSMLEPIDRCLEKKPSCPVAGDLKTTLIGAAAGASAGFLVNLFSTRWSRWRLHRSLRIETQARIGSRASVRVYNGYIFALKGAYAYLTIDHQLGDVLDPPFSAFVSPGSRATVWEDRLCWSVTTPTSNPPMVDIYPGERQSLDVANFSGDWIEFPSEKGWGTMGSTSRVFLKPKRYKATIKIVSKDAKAKEFSVEINPQDFARPIKLA
jgi:hypothetical protein